MLGLIDEAQGARLLTGHSHNEGDAKIREPRAACERRMMKCIGDVVEAMGSIYHVNKPIFVLVHQIHDWTARANKVKNKNIKHYRDPHVWKLTRENCTDDNCGFLYKDSYSRGSAWLGANGEPNGRPVELYDRTKLPLSERPVRVQRLAEPFSNSTIASTEVAIKQLERADKKTATQLRDILDTKGDDRSIGLTFTRIFQDGKVGFPGTLSTSKGGTAEVRVLSGLPDPLWWTRRAESATTSHVPSSPQVTVRVTDAPMSKSNTSRSSAVSAWSCRCGKVYKYGYSCKSAVTHRAQRLSGCGPNTDNEMHSDEDTPSESYSEEDSLEEDLSEEESSEESDVEVGPADVPTKAQVELKILDLIETSDKKLPKDKVSRKAMVEPFREALKDHFGVNFWPDRNGSLKKTILGILKKTLISDHSSTIPAPSHPSDSQLSASNSGGKNRRRIRTSSPQAEEVEPVKKKSKTPVQDVGPESKNRPGVGERLDNHSKRVDSDIIDLVTQGKHCYLCLKECDGTDMVCDRKHCHLSFHKRCYVKKWGIISNWQNAKCMCQHCWHCSDPLRNSVVVKGPCQHCGYDMHLNCARLPNYDYYCPMCWRPYWPMAD